MAPLDRPGPSYKIRAIRFSRTGQATGFGFGEWCARQVCASQLHDLVELVRGELSKLARRTLTAPWA